MRLQKYLTEKTFNISGDVDLVYNKCVKPTHKYWVKGDLETFGKVMQTGKLLGYMSSADLKTKEARAAHELNPIDIYYAFDKEGNYYNPDKEAVHLSLNYQQIDILRDSGYDLQRVENYIGASKMKRFQHELGVSSIKGSIYHELSHWLDDTLHNRHITKMLNRAGENERHAREIMTQGHGNVNQTWYEIEAQIHSIKQMKRDNKKEWEMFTWTDVLQQKSPFVGTVRQSLQNAEYDDYMKHLVKRMHREGLLTRNLQKIPSRQEMWKLVNKI